MPSPWKKLRAAGGSGRGGSGVSRLLAELRPPEQGGSLVVQTGFPTSLADLVVKNRSRLKKTSRKKKSPPASDLDSAVPGPVSSAYASSALPSDVAHGPAGVTFADRPVPVAEEETTSQTATPRRGLGLLLPVTVALVVLAIVKRRKLVIGITLSGFALWLLDSMVPRALRLLKPSPNAERALNPAVKDLDLEGRGTVSPIREEGINTPASERSSVGSIDAELERGNILAIEKAFGEHNISSKHKSKEKKLLRKLIPKNFFRRRVNKDEQEFSDLKGKIVPDSITEIEEGINCDGDDDSGNSTSNSFDKVMDHTGLFQEAERETESRGSKLLVFGAVVLLGLVGGKSAALVLTMSWCLLHKPIESLWKNR